MDAHFVQDDGSTPRKNHDALPYVDKCFTEEETEKTAGEISVKKSDAYKNE